MYVRTGRAGPAEPDWPSQTGRAGPAEPDRPSRHRPSRHLRQAYLSIL